MTESQEDEEIACNNMFKRGIEDAIRESRPISFSEFDAFRSAVGALVPQFLVRSIPQLLFMNPIDALKATNDSIDFIKNHPSLPVSFDVNGSIQLLLRHYHKLETFTTLQSIDSDYFTTDEWRNFMSTPMGTTAKALATSGRVTCLHALIKGHFEELGGSVDLVGELIANCPINPSSEPSLISLLRSCIVPGLNDLVDLSKTLVVRARQLGILNEPKLAQELLDTVLNVEIPDSATPLEQVRATILTSGREEIKFICDPIQKTLSTMCVAFEKFEVSLNFQALESDCMATLECVATDLLVSTGNMDAFTRFCNQFSVNRDRLLSVQVMRVKEQILSNDKRPRLGEDEESSSVSVDSLVEVLYSLVHEISDLETRKDCAYAALTAVDSLNGLSGEKERFTQLARSLVSEDDNSLLSLYLSVRSVQNLLVGYRQFQAPDFLLRRENVLLAATELASLGELQIVQNLANVFPYIDFEEMNLIHSMTLFYSHTLPARESISVGFLEAVLEEPFNALTLEMLGIDIPVHLQQDVQKLRILFLDFAKSESRSTLRKFEEYTMSDFEDLLEGDAAAESRAEKLERARLVFNLPIADSVESLYDVQVNESMGRAEIQSVVSRAHDLLKSLQDPTEIVRLVDQVLVPAGRLLASSISRETWDEFDYLIEGADVTFSGGESSFEDIERSVRLRAFSAQFLMTAPKLAIDSMDTGPSSSCCNNELVNRAQWGLEFERLGIRVPKDLLMEDIHDRRKIKKILTEYFPVWFVRSGMDVDMAKKFGSDFGRAETDILVKCLELILDGRPLWREKGNCVLIELLNHLEKIESFILPAIQRGEQLRWLVTELEAHGVVVLPPQLDRVKKIVSLSPPDDVLVSLGVDRSVRCVVDLLTESLRTGNVEWAVSLSRLAVEDAILSNYTVELVRRICVCPELVGDVHNLLKLVELTLTAEIRERALRQLLSSVPVSTDQLVIAKRFAEEFRGVSEADLKLLENRLVLHKFGVTELNLSLKKLVEHILSNHELISRYDELVDELVSLNGVDGVKLRFDLVKKWISDSEYQENVLGKVLATLGKLKHEKPLEIATCLLKLFFSPDVEVQRKIVAFNALFALVSKQVVMQVYNNSINDLVEIQKNLVYMHMLCNRVIKPLPYKDFVALDKALVVKTLLNAGKAELAQLASLVIADFAVCDYQIIEKLEERVKVLFDGAQATKILNSFQTRMERMGIWYKPAKVHEGKHSQTVAQVANENVAMN